MNEDPRAIIAREPMHRRQIQTIAIATALNALDGFDVLSISFAAPGIAVQWSVRQAALGVVLSMELIGMAIGALALGALADRAGRRPVVLICLIIMASGMALAAISTSVSLLSLSRFYTGLGIGGMLACTNAIVAECANSRRRNLAVSIMAGGYPIGAIIGGIIASTLVALSHRWQAIFLFGALASAGFIPLVLWRVPETVAYLCYRQPGGALREVNRIMALQGHPAFAALPPRPAGPTRLSLAQVFGPDMKSVTIRLAGAYFAHIATFYFLMKWIPKIVVDQGFAPSSAGSVLVWANVGGALGVITIGLLTQRFAMRSLVIAAMVGGAVATGLFGQSGGNFALLTIAAAVAGFFTNGATAGLYAVIAQSFPASLRAGGTGLVIGIGRGGAASGPIIAGLLFARGWPLPWVAAGMGCGTLIAAVALLSLRYREPVVA